MPTTVCPCCGKKMVISERSKNFIVVEGVIMHKKCPAEKMSEEDAKYYQQIKDQLKIYSTSHKYCKNDYIKKYGFNWARTCQRIKELTKKGFSYEEILYTLHQVVMEQDGFYGFGAVVNNIERIVERRKKQKDLEEKHEVEELPVINLGDFEDNVKF